MEAYPDDYVAHNLPFIALSGLPNSTAPSASSDSPTPTPGTGLSITSDLPLLSGPAAEQLLEEFLRADGTWLSWSENAVSDRSGLIGFRLASVGRQFTFPPRKAAPPPIAASLDALHVQTSAGSGSPNSGLELHSPLSPLSPASPIFPDGLFTPLWLAKHQKQVPSVFLSCYRIDADPSQSVLQDNKLKSDINAIRAVFTKAGLHTRHAVLLIADKSVVAAPELEDRIAGIRRATSLDPKAGLFFLPPTSSRAELASFVQEVLTTLAPVCVDYYRDLTKHARRKKGRGFVPSPTLQATRGTSQSLTLHGWNVRYDFKLAVFAEFRQEMDVAQRHYESALEELFDSEGSLETVPSWSPRWEHARLLCDIIAFRILRCQIWRASTTGAAESWSNYKDRMKDLIDRRGKGSDGYGWEAWEGRWAKMMAQLIEMADLPVFRPVNHSTSGGEEVEQSRVSATYALPEKAFAAVERLPPFQYLHHPGYWWRIVSTHILGRRKKAEAIPAEDRSLPDQTSNAQLASRTRTYDTYLVPQPHEELPLDSHAGHDYLLELQSTTERAEIEFASRGQARAVQLVKVDFARELVRVEKFAEARELLRPVWDAMTWRNESWYDLAGKVLELICESALRTEDALLELEASWEMACRVFRPRQPVNIMGVLEKVREVPARQTLSLSSQTRMSPICLTFAFIQSEGYVGDAATCQVALTYNADTRAEPVTLSDLRVHFNTNIRSLQIVHADSAAGIFTFPKDVREESDPSHPMAKSLVCSANLTIVPCETRVFNVAIPLRDAENFGATGASIMLRSGDASMEYVFSQPSDISARQYWQRSGDGLVSRLISRSESNVMTVLPKPPRMQIQLRNLREQYFTNEHIALEIGIVNEEDEESNVKLVATAVDDADAPVQLEWRHNGEVSTEDNGDGTLALGKMAAGHAVTHHLRFTAPEIAASYTLSLQAQYTLASDPETPVQKVIDLVIQFVSPFEANYDFGPRLHPAAYPNFFDLSDTGKQDQGEGTPAADGIEQRWCLLSRVASFSSTPLIVESTSVVVNRITSNAVCKVKEPKAEKGSQTIQARGMTDVSHVLDTRKVSLEDRRPFALDLSLSIIWRRQDAPAGTTTTTTLLPVPHLTIPSSEPRVLCTVDYLRPKHDVAAITYTIENPSMHFLTFTVTMEASDAFAFSGPKFHAISLTPMSRASVRYKLLVFASDAKEVFSETNAQRGRWIWPVLKVVDYHFNKSLRVLDAGEGVKSDEKGGVGVWMPLK